MQDIPHDAVAAAFAQVVRGALMQGQDVHVPELGTFRIHHEASRLEETPEKQMVITPPADTIAFRES